MQSVVSRLRHVAVALGTASALAVGMAMSGGAAPAAADYGNTAVYQIEISANSIGPSGGGAWLWIELDSNGTGTYAGSDCGHGDGAVADSGDITSWSSSGGVLTISGVALFGGLAPVTIHVPSTHGNYIETISQVFGLPFPGFAVVEVAP
jgi:hypothetical protein